MKKLILSLLTLASLTACKKDIVEPVTVVDVDRLPKRIYTSSDSTFKDSSHYVTFTYYENGLLKSDETENHDFRHEYEYIGKNISKSTSYVGDNLFIVAYTYENNLLKSYSSFQNNKLEYKLIYHYVNNKVDYILSLDSNEQVNDSITVIENTNQLKFSKFSNSQINPTISIFNYTDSSIVDVESNYQVEYVYLNKIQTIQFQILSNFIGVIRSIAVLNPGYNHLIESKNQNKYLLKTNNIENAFVFDGNDRLIRCNSKMENILTDSLGIYEEKILNIFQKITY